MTQASSFAADLKQYSYEEAAPMSPARRVTRSTLPVQGTKISTKTPSPSKHKDFPPKSHTAAPQPASISLKRKTSGQGAVASPSPLKAKRSSSGYAPPSKYAHLTNLLTDSLALNLICIFIGVNPGIRTATAGHAYAHPSNLFWKLCYSSGCTPRLCKPQEDRDLPHLYALGHTNIVTRPTKDASELSAQEMDEGVEVLEEKIRQWRPESVCIVGKSIWKTIWRVRHGKKIAKSEFKYGWQVEEENMGVIEGADTEGWPGAKVFVATTTSGLAAGMRPHEKEEVWRGLGEWVARRRKERGIPDEGCSKTTNPKIPKEDLTVEDRTAE